MKKLGVLKRFIITMSILCILSSYIAVHSEDTGIWKVSASSLARPSVSIPQRTATTVTLSIKKVAAAKGYRIYRSTSVDGTYKAIATTSATTYKDSNLKSTSKYYYKVRAYKVVNGKNVYSSYSSAVSVTATLKKTENVKASQVNTYAKVTWNRVSNASKYNVYRSNSVNGDFEYIGSTTSQSYTDKSVQAGKTYYYRVRAYKKSNSIKYYGVYSAKTKISLAGTVDNEGSSGNGGSTSSSSNDAYTKEVLRLVNIERSKEGLSQLTTTSNLEMAAFVRAKETKQSFSHTRPDGSSFSSILKEYNISYQASGENIAYGQKSPEAVVNAWMNSSGHRANIMSSNFNKIGIGCYIDSNNVVYWTQLFTN